MKQLFLPILPLLLALVAAGCTTKSKARAQANEAFLAGENQALKASQEKDPSVTVIGQVRKHTLRWEEGLTLAQAIDAAVYTGFTDPRYVVLTRGQERVQIKINDLLRGITNPELEPGDIIDIQQ
jgi:hypothetical protein